MGAFHSSRIHDDEFILLSPPTLNANSTPSTDISEIFSLVLSPPLANTIFDTRQELKSQKETSLIKEKFNKKYLIKRDKHKIKLNLGEIKVGDLIYLDSNELVPADCIILEKNNLTVDQSVFLNYEKAFKLIGEELSKETIKKIVASLDIKVNSSSDAGLGLIIPSYRVDVQREVDVIEEILRV